MRIVQICGLCLKLFGSGILLRLSQSGQSRRKQRNVLRLITLVVMPRVQVLRVLMRLKASLIFCHSLMQTLILSWCLNVLHYIQTLIFLIRVTHIFEEEHLEANIGEKMWVALFVVIIARKRATTLLNVRRLRGTPVARLNIIVYFF